VGVSLSHLGASAGEVVLGPRHPPLVEDAPEEGLLLTEVRGAGGRRRGGRRLGRRPLPAGRRGRLHVLRRRVSTHGARRRRLERH
jgi:hypothetical protein